MHPPRDLGSARLQIRQAGEAAVSSLAHRGLSAAPAEQTAEPTLQGQKALTRALSPACRHQAGPANSPRGRRAHPWPPRMAAAYPMGPAPGQGDGASAQSPSGSTLSGCDNKPAGGRARGGMGATGLAGTACRCPATSPASASTQIRRGPSFSGEPRGLATPAPGPPISWVEVAWGAPPWQESQHRDQTTQATQNLGLPERCLQG